MQDHRPALLSYAVRHGCSWADAEDTIQEVWLKLIRTGRLDELQSQPHDEQLGKLKMRLRCAIIRSRQRSSSMRLIPFEDLAEQVDCAALPDHALDLVWLREVLDAAGMLETEPGCATRGRVAMHRRRVALRPLLVAWRD